MSRVHGVLERGTLGQAGRRIVLAGLILTETRHAPRTTIDSHAHIRAGINLVLGGRYGERVRGSFQIHPPATLIVKPAGEPHANRFEESGARCLLLEFELTAIERLGMMAVPLSRPEVLRLGSLAGLVPLLLRALRAELPPVALEEAVLRLLEHTGGQYRLTSDRGHPGWLNAARDRIHATTPKRVRLGELAMEAGVHPAHLSETFRATFGVTITRYVERLRLERDVTALAATDDPVGRIALQAGFYDHSHFSRVFRRATGVTSSEFRGSLRS